ncbi:tail sheath protein [Listeria phage LP-083-2]|uniref:Tail sheath protein n=3 Tax=Pecentumvirus TaxID=1857844 RepID=A0A059T6T5_9CAUD|nr:tail sheath [Listeria phage LP-083-2]YP_009784540.1 tail sheath protein [Listeria phage LP-124]AHL19314.1 tail sheath protein [Listeria phage LP-083-2]AHL19425.1 tail sheath protein [Listeria phage LP-124]QDK04939.2 tail sheath [Listeria phage LP-066]
MAIEIYPRKPVSRPHTEISVDTSGIGGSSSGSEKILCLVGSATGGKPNAVYKVRNYSQAKSVFRSGELLDAIERAWNPGEGAGAGDILAMRVEEAKEATFEAEGVKVSSTIYGADANDIQVALEDNTITGTKRLSIVFAKERVNQVYDNLGNIFSIKYKGTEASATFTVAVDPVTFKATKLTLKAGDKTVKEYDLGSGAYAETNVLISDINNLPDFEAKFFPIGDKNLTTDNFDAQIDVDIKTKEAYVKAVGGDIEKQTAYNGYVDFEFDRSKEIANFPLTKLTGGDNGTIPESWADKFSYFANEGGYYLVPLTSKQAVHAEALQFVRDCSYNGNPMRVFVGGGIGESMEQLFTRAIGLQNERAGLIGFSGTVKMDDGRSLKMPGYMFAAQVAGLTCGLEIGEAITFKNIAIETLDTIYEGSQLDQLNESGIITAEFVRNRAVTNFRIVDDVTTFNDKTDPVKSEIGVGEANDFLVSELKISLDNEYIGTKIIDTSASLVKNFVQSFLDRKKLAKEIQDYSPEEVQVVIEGDVARISLTVFPIRSMKKIEVSLVYRQQILTA